MNRNILSKTILALFLAFAINLPLNAQVLTEKQIDSLVEKTLSTFNVPGIAVSVIKDGKVVHSKGYGLRSIQSDKKVDEIPCLVWPPIPRPLRPPRWASWLIRKN